MSQNSIPASQLVSVQPSVIGAGSTALSLNAIFITQSNKVPVGELTAFTSNSAVANVFGVDSPEAQAAAIYFKGFTGSTATPGNQNGASAFFNNGSTSMPSGLYFTQMPLGASVPATMSSLFSNSQNWVTFTTMWEPDTATKTAFADWVNSQNQRFAYVMWDSDEKATKSNSASLGALFTANKYDGVIPVYNDLITAAFVCAIAASINFNERNGRITFAFRAQSGLSPVVTDVTIANNLIANGYNFYGAYATATQRFTFLQPGQITGKWLWIDAFLNQIFLNAALQQAVMQLYSNSKSIPYNVDGYTMIRAACMPVIEQALNFGAIRAGVPLDADQASTINTQAGTKIDNTLTTQGWYLQILPATPQARVARKSPPIGFWYTDGGSIQQINIASIDVQ